MKIITYNMQGKNWEAVKWRLDQEKPDVMVIQECGNLGNALGYNVAGRTDKAVHVGDYAGYHIWWLDWSRTGAGSNNPRCSLCMCFKDGGEPIVLATNDTDKRPIMIKTVGSWVVGNLHAGGRQYIEEAIQAVKTRGAEKSWVLAGDFNQSPTEMGDNGLVPEGAGIVATPYGTPTRPKSNRRIDYGVTNQVGTAVTMVDYGGSDHVAVVITLNY